MNAATPGPGPKPTGPTHPTPSAPRPSSPFAPGRADDAIFAALDAILDDLKSPARRDPTSISVRTVATTGGPATFTLPAAPEPPRFACDPYPPPYPGSPPGPPPQPNPKPQIAIGVGPQYDALPRWDR